MQGITHRVDPGAQASSSRNVIRLMTYLLTAVLPDSGLVSTPPPPSETWQPEAQRDFVQWGGKEGGGQCNLVPCNNRLRVLMRPTTRNPATHINHAEYQDRL